MRDQVFTTVDLQPGGRLHVDYAALLTSRWRTPHLELEAVWAEQYMLGLARGTDPDIRSFGLDPFTWTWDVTEPQEDQESSENRLLGVYGLTTAPASPRDAYRMRGFPLQSDSNVSLHRGHAAAHSLGGPDEGFNLFPQLAAFNLGRKWRSLERLAAKAPGTRLAVRTVYADWTGRPALVELALLTPGGVLGTRDSSTGDRCPD